MEVVLIASKSSYKIVHRDDIKPNAEILIAAEIILKHNQKITLVVFYRPPNSDLYPLEELQRILSKVSTSELIVVGDFNITEIDWSNASTLTVSALPNLLLDIVHDNFLSQMIFEPTRDLVLTTSTDYVQDACVGDPFSNHNLIIFKIDKMPYKTKPCSNSHYCYRKADWAKLQNLLHLAPWHLSSTEHDMDSKWQVWKDLLASAVDDSIPKVGAKRRQNAPWITRELILLCRKKRSAYKKAKRTGKTRDQNYYSKLNNMVKRKCNIARWEYINSLAETISSNDAKPFWRYVNSKRKGTNNLILLKTQDGEITNDSEIAESMNNYCSSVFTKETFEKFPSMIQRTKDSLTNIECTVAEVERHLKQLNVNKSLGPDDISPHVLKQCCTQLAPSLTTILNKSFSTGKLPYDWKIANVQGYINESRNL